MFFGIPNSKEYKIMISDPKERYENTEFSLMVNNTNISKYAQI